MSEVTVISPFRMGDSDYKPGDTLEVNKEKQADLYVQGLIKEKAVIAPAVNKQQTGNTKKGAGKKKKV